MQYDFLKNFPKRMKNVGLYSLLVQNSFQKTTWKQYGFIKSHEQINMIFAVLLYIMEQSLKEENCTLDDIGAYIDTLNMQYLRKNISYEECKELGDFIVNTILCNEGRPMYFEGFDFEQGAYQRMNVSYVVIGWSILTERSSARLIISRMTATVFCCPRWKWRVI